MRFLNNSPTLWLAQLALCFGLSGVAGAVPCDVSWTMDVSPRMPDDASTVTYTLEYCDPYGFGADIGNALISLSRFNFVPNTGVWLTCPRTVCGRTGPDGAMTIGSFALGANECAKFEFTAELQCGLGGDRVCIQGAGSVYSYNPPTIPFPCNKNSDDPLTITIADPTCITVVDPAPGCDIDMAVDPSFLSTCAGSSETLTCIATETGCPGGTLEYEWTRDGVPIPGLTDPVVTIPASEPPGGSQFRCIARCAALPACKRASIPVQVTILASASSANVPPNACVNDDVPVQVFGALSCTTDCGDGSPTVPSCFHTCNYSAPGRYMVSVDIDDGSCQFTDVKTVDIFDQARACIDAVATLCEDSAAGPTTFDLSSCSVPGLDYTWSTSLGSFADPSVAAPSLILPDVSVPTTVTVTLTISDPSGCGIPDTTDITFDLLPAPTLTTSYLPVPACSGEVVDFTGSASGPGPFDYLWDFGDTTTSTAQNPSHTYATAGSYDVSVTATDTAGGCDGSETFSLLVEDCNTCPPTLPAVTRLLCVKEQTLRLDVEMAWEILTDAQDGYNVWAASAKQDIPLARDPGGPGIRGACTPSVASNCVDPGVVPDSSVPELFYQVRGLCGAIEGE